MVKHVLEIGINLMQRFRIYSEGIPLKIKDKFRETLESLKSKGIML